MNKSLHKLFSLLFLTILVVSCAGPDGIQLPSMEVPLREFSKSEPTVVFTPTVLPTPVPTGTATKAASRAPTITPTITPLPYPLWIDPSVPDALREETLDWNLSVATSAASASLQLGVAGQSDANTPPGCMRWLLPSRQFWMG